MKMIADGIRDLVVAVNRLFNAVTELTVAVEHIGELIRNGHCR